MTSLVDGQPGDDAPPAEAIEDTWGWKQDAASWSVAFDGPPAEPAVANPWWRNLIAGLLDDFETLVRVRDATLIDDREALRLPWRRDEPYVHFREQLLAAVGGHAGALTTVELQLDLRVWVRTKESPDRPVLTWIAYPGTTIVAYVALHDRHGWVQFDLAQSLFSAMSVDGEDNHELHVLNQPLLAAALERWQNRVGGPLEVGGELRGTHPLGFSSDREDY